MKNFVVTIKPYQLEEVKEVLERNGVTKFLVDEAKGFGFGKGHTEIYHGSEYQVESLPKMRISFVADDEKVDGLIQDITTATKTRHGNDTTFVITGVERYIDLSPAKKELSAPAENQRRR